MIATGRYSNQRLQLAYVDQFREILPSPTHALTISFASKWIPTAQIQKLELALGAASVFMHFLNNRSFGHAHRRNGFKVGCIAVAEGMGYQQRVHLHLSLQKPMGMKEKCFDSAILKSLQLVNSFGDYCIKPWRDEGWSQYITKEKDCCLLYTSPSPRD